MDTPKFEQAVVTPKYFEKLSFPNNSNVIIGTTTVPNVPATPVSKATPHTLNSNHG